MYSKEPCQQVLLFTHGRTAGKAALWIPLSVTAQRPRGKCQTEPTNRGQAPGLAAQWVGV